ncbi:MAG: hypothetical protein AAF939_13190 [Planctomycetota bacterium]
MAKSDGTVDEVRLRKIIESFAESLDEVQLQLVIQSAGVAQAIDALRKALDKTERCLRGGKYEEVANLGYRDVSSEFIFLQRTMGAINEDAMQRSSVISDICREAKLAYEVVEPHVMKWLEGRDLSSKTTRKFKNDA